MLLLLQWLSGLSVLRWHGDEQVRPQIQDMLRKAVAKMKAALPSGQSDEIVAFLTNQLVGESLVESSKLKAGEKTVNLWFNEESAAEVRRWANANNTNSITSQAAYVAALSAVSKRLREQTTSADGLALGDLVYTLAEAIFASVPAGVPSFAVALCVKIDAATTAERAAGTKNQDSVDLKSLVPDFSHFLCNKVTITEDNQDSQLLCHCVARCVVTCAAEG